MVKRKRVSVVVAVIFYLWSNIATMNTDVMASELYYTVETEENLQIDFVKIRETFSKGNLQLPKSFQKELFLYDTVTNAVGEYCSENEVKEVFRLDVERDMFSEATDIIDSRGEPFCVSLQWEKIDFGEKHFKLEVEGEDHSLYVDVDLEGKKVWLYYPSDEMGFDDATFGGGNPVAYEQRVFNEDGGGVKYYPDMYVEQDWDDLGRVDSHFEETYDGMFEDLMDGKLDYLVLTGDIRSGTEDRCINVAVVLARYMEENHIEDVFYFDPDKDIISRVTNMIFTCRLQGKERTLYIDLDDFNIKAHVYEVEK